ncbi:Uncharacterised protein [Arcanobacterium haemolyticum]|uniref:Helicase n=2 Tax=Arcanobacterium haemolyticum TaxID=28264 RepID=D7BP22_ARCHD|nr:conserved hypothetical protein [Arcanobacterium haemolyticum DSM 20595]SQH28592.1 Uncharacterised protein [Arcanobacterium haemolyticum]
MSDYRNNNEHRSHRDGGSSGWKPAGERRWNNDRNDRRDDRGERRWSNDRNDRRDDRGPRKWDNDRREDRGGRRWNNDRNDRRDDRGPRKWDNDRREDRGGRRWNNDRNDRRDDRGPRKWDNDRRDDRGPRKWDNDRREDRGERRWNNDRNDRREDRGERRWSNDRNDRRDDRGPRKWDNDRREDRGERRWSNDRNDRRDDRGPRKWDNDRREDRGERRGGDRREERYQRNSLVAEIPESITAQSLDAEVRRHLMSLNKENSETVARHLAYAGEMMDIDPEVAYTHAHAAYLRAARVDVVREALGLTAYITGRYAEALRELRTYRRMSDDYSHIPLEADSERGMGRPEKALRFIEGVPLARLDAEAKIELALVTSGARAETGDHEGGLSVLEKIIVENLDSELAARVQLIKADRLEELGRLDEATELRAEWEAVLEDNEDFSMMVDLDDVLDDLPEEPEMEMEHDDFAEARDIVEADEEEFDSEFDDEENFDDDVDGEKADDEPMDEEDPEFDEAFDELFDAEEDQRKDHKGSDE